MVEHEGSYDFMSGRRFVELAARLRKIDDWAAAATRSIERVNLSDAADRADPHLLARHETADSPRGDARARA